MRRGKVKAALRLVEDYRKGGVLLLGDTIQINAKQKALCEVLMEKHPAGQPAHPETILQPPTPILDVHPVLFDHLDGEIIRKAAL